MTCRELIERTDRLRPNAFPFEDKLAWLSQLDLRAFEEVILTHEHEAGITFAGHHDGEAQALIPPPWDEVYHYYLCMQMDLSGREIPMYNNDRALFTSAFVTWQDKVNRERMPLGQVERVKM